MIDMSSSKLYHLNNLNIQNERVSYQMSTGKVLDDGSDNSILHGQVINIENKLRVTEGLQLQIDRTLALNETADTSVDQIKLTLENAKTELLKSLNSGMVRSDRLAVATGMEGLRSTLLDRINESVDGEYLFSGSDTTKRAFVKDADFALNGQVEFNGNGNLRKIAIEPGIYRDRGVTGFDVMMYTTDTAATSGNTEEEKKIAFTQTERIIDENKDEWIFSKATVSNQLSFDGGDTIRDNDHKLWVLNEAKVGNQLTFDSSQDTVKDSNGVAWSFLDYDDADGDGDLTTGIDYDRIYENGDNTKRFLSVARLDNTATELIDQSTNYSVYVTEPLPETYDLDYLTVGGDTRLRQIDVDTVADNTQITDGKIFVSTVDGNLYQSERIPDDYTDVDGNTATLKDIHVDGATSIRQVDSNGFLTGQEEIVNEEITNTDGNDIVNRIATYGNELTFDKSDTIKDNNGTTWSFIDYDDADGDGDITTGVDYDRLYEDGDVANQSIIVYHVEGDRYITQRLHDDSGTTPEHITTTIGPDVLFELNVSNPNGTGDFREFDSDGNLTTIYENEEDVELKFQMSSTLNDPPERVLEVKHNIFDELNVIINALKGYATNLDGTQGDEIDDATVVDVLSAQLGKVSAQYNASNIGHAELGGRNHTFDLAQDRLMAKETHYNILLQEVNGADMAKLAMESKQLEMTYQALYATIARMNELSLMNYLK